MRRIACATITLYTLTRVMYFLVLFMCVHFYVRTHSSLYGVNVCTVQRIRKMYGVHV